MAGRATPVVSSLHPGGAVVKRSFSTMVLVAVTCAGPLLAQDAVPDSGATLRLNSRAVLVDVIVTDRDGKPVTGLTKDSFRLTEEGRPQSVSYFEEHRGLLPEQ